MTVAQHPSSHTSESHSGSFRGLVPWLDEYVRDNGRPPRILHIGNIANNAYCNAKALNEAGFDCDVLCYDYYHLMGCPEWEDADFEGDVGDHFDPNWRGIDLAGYKRPRWFVQGPHAPCIRYLVARRRGQRLRAWAWWTWLEAIRDSRSNRPVRLLVNLVRRFKIPLFSRGVDHPFIPTTLRQSARMVIGHGLEVSVRAVLCLIGVVGLFYFALVDAVRLTVRRPANLFQRGPRSELDFTRRADQLVDLFAEVFPDRTDKLTVDDLRMYKDCLGRWQELFEQYDIVQGYATDPIHPLLAAKRPYVAFEHGTLRDFTMADEQLHRCTSLAYRLSDHTFITNGDCLEYARRIGIARYTPMLHPIDEQRIRAVQGDYESLHREYGADHLFLCPLRHDWEVKGTDRYIRALPALREAIGPSFRVLMTKWGTQLDESRRLARELEVGDLVVWIEPLPRTRLHKTLKSVDALFDQIALPHFGATAPEGIAAEVPVIMSYDPKSTAWIVDRPAPILSAWTTAEIVAAVQTALDPVWREAYRERARRWIDKCHNLGIVVSTHARVYGELLNSTVEHQERLSDDNHDPAGRGAEAPVRGLRQDARLQHDRV